MLEVTLKHFLKRKKKKEDEEEEEQQQQLNVTLLIQGNRTLQEEIRSW
jgi:hypothetical protein